MRILALETTERCASLAALQGDNLLVEMTLGPDQRSAQSLAPGLKRLLETVGWKIGDVGLVGVSMGPGSFTGLRLGVTTAKILAYVARADILGIDTLEAIAAATPEGIDSVWTGIDAQRGQTIVRPVRRDGAGWFEPVGPSRLVDAGPWLASLPAGGTVSGPILREVRGVLPPGVEALPEELWAPRAAVVGRLAQRHHAAGRRDDLWGLAPRYSRPSAAEEKWDSHQGGG